MPKCIPLYSDRVPPPRQVRKNPERHANGQSALAEGLARGAGLDA